MAEDRILTALSDATDEQIRKELVRRRRNRLEEERSRVAFLREWVKTHVNILLEVVQDHYLMGCSDDNPYNAGRECDRCKLIQIKRHDNNTKWVPDIRLNQLTDDQLKRRTAKLFSESEE